MEWNVFRDDGGEIVVWNIFRHAGFLDGCREAYRKYGNDRGQFLEAARKELLYYFWARCEWEVLMESWPPVEGREKKLKVDVYDQVTMNWSIFSKYIWANRDKLGEEAA